MSDLVKHYRQGLEQHLELVETNHQLTTISSVIQRTIDGRRDGFEELDTEAFKNGLRIAANGVLSVGKWVGGQAFDLLSKSMKAAGSQLSETFDDNKSFIKRIRNELKDYPHTLKIDTGVAGNLTSTGKWKDFNHDLDELIQTTEKFHAHGKAILDHLNHELMVIRELKGVKKNDDILKVVDKFDALNYPNWALPHKNGDTMLSEVLPGGRVFKFKATDTGVEYSMSGDKPAGEATEVSLSKSEITELLGKVDKLNELLLQTKQSYDRYLEFVKSWGDAVKQAMNHLDDGNGLSQHVIAEAEKLMKGNANGLAFYSGFTPRVINYVDKYIHGVLGVCTKVI